MADILIRQAVPADADAIHEIETLSFPDPWSSTSIRFELEQNPDAFYVVAVREGEVVGYAGLWWVLDEGHITNVAVRPGFHHRKIGTGILQTLIDHTHEKGINHYTLEVARNNEAAIGLYEKFGFVTEGVRKGYYAATGEDALLMWFHLED